MKLSLERLLTIGSISAVVLLTLPYLGIYVEAFAPYPHTNVDSSIILSEMERLAEGWRPYTQMHLNYPPLWFYLMAGLKLLFGVPYNCYPFYLGLHYLVVAGICVLLYRSVRLYSPSRWLPWAAVAFCLFMGFWYRAFFILFEPMSVLFGLWAIYLTLSPRFSRTSWHFLIIGAVACCAFMVKQFGLGFGMLIALYLLLTLRKDNRREVLMKLLYLIIGIVLPIALCIGIWGQDFIASVLLNGYGTSVNAQAGEDVSVAAKGMRIGGRLVHFLFAECVIALAGIAAFRTARKEGLLPLWVLCMAGIAGFAGQYYFVIYTQFPHYNFYMLPFVCLLTPIIARWADGSKMKIAFCVLCLAGSGIYGVQTYIDKIVKPQPTDIEAFDESELPELLPAEGTYLFDRVEAIIPEDGTIWIPNMDVKKYWFQINRIPPNMHDIAYSTGSSELTAEKAERQMLDADYVLCLKGDKWDRQLRPCKQGYDVEENLGLRLYKNK